MLRMTFVIVGIVVLTACDGPPKLKPQNSPAGTSNAAGAIDGAGKAAAQSAIVDKVPVFPVSTAAPDIAKGKELFGAKGCVACHRPDSTRLVGPGLQGVMARRGERWVKAMIIDPEGMLKSDGVAKKLLAEYMVPMANQNVHKENELPYLVAYLNSLR